VWSHIKPCLQAASDDPARFAGVQVLGVDEHVWHHQDRRRRGPTRAHRHRRPDTQEGAPHGPLERTWSQEGLAPRMRTWLAERGEDFRAGVRIATLDPLPGTARTPSTTSSKTPPASSTPFTSSRSPVTPSMKYTAASSKTRPDTEGAKVTPSTKSAIFCAPHTRRLTPRQKERLREAFVADEAHISVEVAYLHRASARGLPPSHTHPRPTPGRTPHPAPKILPHPRNRLTGPDPTQVEGRTRRLLRHSRSQQRTTPKPSTDIIELGRRTARGYRNPTNYQPRMPLTTAGLDASTHTQL